MSDEKEYLRQEAKRLEEQRRRDAAIEAELRKSKEESAKREADRLRQQQKGSKGEQNSWS